MLFAAFAGPGLLLALVVLVVARHCWRRAKWVLLAAIPGPGLLLALAGWVAPANLGGGSFW